VKKSSLVSSAGLVSVITAVSRITGLVREQVMAYYFGASMATDAFVTAFRIPNLLRDMFAEGALSAAFVPIFKEKLVNETDESAFDLARTVITGILVVVGGIVLLGIVATPAIIYVSATGFTDDPTKFDLTVSLTRWMFPYLLLVSLSALIMGMLNSFGRFGIPAIAPALFNLGIVALVFILYGVMEMPVYSMAYGVLLGGLGQLLIQVPPLLRLGFRFRFRFNLFDESVKRVLRLIGPMIAGMSAGRVNILVSTLLASFLTEGTMSYLNYSYRLMHFPLGVFAVALGTVTLPRASEIAARNDMPGLARNFGQAINLNMFLILPSAAFLAFMSHDIVQLVYQWGRFDEVACDRTALTLLHYSYGLIGFAAVRVTVPTYYALKDSMLPMKASIASVVLNLLLYYPLILILDFAGLAAATSIAGLANFAFLLYYLPSRGVPVDFGPLFLGFLRISVAAVLATFLARMVPISFSFGGSAVWNRALDLLTTLALMIILYFAFCAVLRVKELTTLRQRLRDRAK
jgi:putative peptidoglycan lipid II flippase